MPCIFLLPLRWVRFATSEVRITHQDDPASFNCVDMSAPIFSLPLPRILKRARAGVIAILQSHTRTCSRSNRKGFLAVTSLPFCTNVERPVHFFPLLSLDPSQFVLRNVSSDSVRVFSLFHGAISYTVCMVTSSPLSDIFLSSLPYFAALVPLAFKALRQVSPTSIFASQRAIEEHAFPQLPHPPLFFLFAFPTRSSPRTIFIYLPSIRLPRVDLPPSHARVGPFPFFFESRSPDVFFFHVLFPRFSFPPNKHQD